MKSQSQQIKAEFASGQAVQKRSYGFRLLLGILILLFIALSFLAKTQSLLFLDLFITTYVQQIQFPGFENIMNWLTFLGNPVPALIVLGLFWVILYILN